MNIRTFLCVLLFFGIKLCSAQEEIEWQPAHQLTFKDFWSPATSFNSPMLSIHPGTRIDFSYQMSNYEFMFRKNFNDKVTCKFIKVIAAIVAPDSNTANNLLQLAAYDFDLGELYARKLRKRIFEEKDAFSSTQFFQPIFNEVDKERTVAFNNAATDTNFGQDAAKLSELHNAVLKEIESLSDFCKECKPRKIKRK